jgi:protein-tyrosine phosphatase
MAERLPMRVLFCCMGNICRSPSAEGVFRAQLAAAGLHEAVDVDSAGTDGWHAGEAPDARATRHAARRGYDLSSLRARRVEVADFERFDLVLAMDHDNLARLRALCPPPRQAGLRLLMSYAPDAGSEVVPDPYYGGAAGFERVLDLIELGCRGLLAQLRAELDSRRG